MGIFGGGDSTHDDFLRLEARVRDLEQRVAHLTALVGGGHASGGAGPADPTTVTPWEAEVRDLVARGNKIEAIKRTREITGWGLKEAKEHVDRL